MLHEDAKKLPPDIMVVAAAVARALGDRMPTPEAISQIQQQFANSLFGHVAKIEHRPRAPKGAKPRLKATYTISIIGPRIDGRWSFSPGQFVELLGKAQGIDPTQNKFPARP